MPKDKFDVVMVWDRDNIPHRLIFDAYSMSEERIFRVQYKKNKTWQSYTPWYGLKILGEYLRDQ